MTELDKEETLETQGGTAITGTLKGRGKRSRTPLKVLQTIGQKVRDVSLGRSKKNAEEKQSRSRQPDRARSLSPRRAKRNAGQEMEEQSVPTVESMSKEPKEQKDILRMS